MAKKPAPKPQTKQPPKFDFPAAGRKCPRCGCWDTQAVSTQENVQYRLCRRGTCRHRYTVIGTPVGAEKAK